MLLQLLEVWNPFLQRNITRPYSAHSGIITSLVNSPSKGIVASVSDDQWIKIWEWHFFVDQDTTVILPCFFYPNYINETINCICPFAARMHFGPRKVMLFLAHHQWNELFERLFQLQTLTVVLNSILSLGSWVYLKCSLDLVIKWQTLIWLNEFDFLNWEVVCNSNIFLLNDVLFHIFISI